MKKPYYSAAFLAALAGLAAWPQGARADDVAFRPYVGADAQYTDFGYNNNYDLGGGLALDGDAILEDGLPGFNIHVGNRFHKNFGAELGYFRTKEQSKDVAAGSTVGPGPTVALTGFTTKVKAQGVTLDALGYVPLDEAARFELIGTAGVSYTKAELEFAGYGSEDESEFGYRLGAGAQYGLDDNISVRGLARYQSADFEDVADNAWTYSLGVNYAF